MGSTLLFSAFIILVNCLILEWRSSWQSNTDVVTSLELTENLNRNGGCWKVTSFSRFCTLQDSCKTRMCYTSTKHCWEGNLEILTFDFWSFFNHSSISLGSKNTNKWKNEEITRTGPTDGQGIDLFNICI